MEIPSTVEIIKIFVQLWVAGAVIKYAYLFFSGKEPDVFECLFWPLKWLEDWFSK